MDKLDFEQLAESIEKGMLGAFNSKMLTFAILFVLMGIVGYIFKDDTETIADPIFTDHETGCQYFVDKNNGKFPRWNADGTHLCN